MKKARILTKRSLAILLTLILAMSIAACGGGTDTQTPNTSENTPSTPPSQTPDTPDTPPEPDPVELIIFAAASMTNTLEEVAELYKEAAPHVTLVFNFDSSGTLKTQIENGADCDVFVSAAQRQMNELAELDFVEAGTRIDILENKAVLVVAPGNPKDINSFEGLAEALVGGSILMAMGNSDVPVGQYTQNILKYFELDEEVLARSGVITYGSNVREVTTQVTEASADVGVVYATDAFSTNLQVVDTASADMCGGQVIYPAAVLNITSNVDEAAAFLDYLTTPPAMAVFENVGFSPV